MENSWKLKWLFMASYSTIIMYTGDTGLRGPIGQVGIKGAKGDQGDRYI